MRKNILTLTSNVLSKYLMNKIYLDTDIYTEVVGCVFVYMCVRHDKICHMTARLACAGFMLFCGGTGA